jgi:hypothetical protein
LWTNLPIVITNEAATQMPRYGRWHLLPLAAL